MEQIKIDIVPAGVAPVAHASQFDNGRQIRFNLFNQGTPYTLTGAETITMVVNGEEENITNTSDNYVIWDVAEEDCEEVGVIGCEIRIVLGSMLIGSKNFFLEVEMDPYNGKNVRTVTVGPADICTFETTLPEPYQSVLVNVEATGGNGTPDNPNPINGYTEANITRCGVNLLSGTLEDYQASTREYGLSTFIAYKLPNGTYTISTNAPTGYIWAGKSLDNGPIDISTYLRVYDGNPMTITLSGTQDLIVGVLTTDKETACSYNTMVNIDSSPSAYHPYTGNTYTIAFGQTVYGGQLIITPDRTYFHVTHELVTYNGSENWLVADAVFYIGIASEYRTEQKPICNIYDGVEPIFYQNLPNGKITLSAIVLNNLLVRDDSIATVEDFKTALSNQNMQVVLKLATPFDIDLTPEVISAVVGTNNVFADCGETEVKYLKAGA